MCEPPPDLSKIKNVQLLLDHFGGWPCFHDAEIKSIHLDSGNLRPNLNCLADSTLTMEIVSVDWPRFNEKEEFVYETKITLIFRSIEFELVCSFGNMTTMDALALKEEEKNPDTGYTVFKVEILPHGSEIPFITFECDEIEVASIENIEHRTQKGSSQ